MSLACQPPPTALIRDTLASSWRPSNCTAPRCLASDAACVVSTDKYVLVPAWYWLIASRSDNCAALTAWSCTWLSCASTRKVERLSSTSCSPLKTVCLYVATAASNAARAWSLRAWRAPPSNNSAPPALPSHQTPPRPSPPSQKTPPPQPRAPQGAAEPRTPRRRFEQLRKSAAAVATGTAQRQRRKPSRARHTDIGIGSGSQAFFIGDIRTPLQQIGGHTGRNGRHAGLQRGLRSQCECSRRLADENGDGMLQLRARGIQIDPLRLRRAQLRFCLRRIGAQGDTGIILMPYQLQRARVISHGTRIQILLQIGHAQLQIILR